MKNKIFLTVLSLLILTTLSSADLGSFEQNTPVPIRVLSNCTSVNLTEVNGVSINALMTDLGGQTFYYNYTNTSEVGEYTFSWSPSCESCTEVNCGNSFSISPFGEDANMASAFVQIFLLLFFFSLIIGFYMLRRQINFEKWHEGILRKYQLRNTPKVVLSSIGYNLVKNSLLVYYLLIFPILTILLNLISSFSVGALSSMTDLMLTLYGVGLVIVGLVFLGRLQQFIAEMIDLVKDKEWGII